MSTILEEMETQVEETAEICEEGFLKWMYMKAREFLVHKRNIADNDCYSASQEFHKETLEDFIEFIRVPMIDPTMDEMERARDNLNQLINERTAIKDTLYSLDKED